MTKDGTVYSTREVHCAKCGAFIGGLGKYYATELKEHYGWRQVSGRGWCCKNCLVDLTTTNIRSRDGMRFLTIGDLRP